MAERRWRQVARDALRRGLIQGRRIPAGLRSLLGVALIFGGFLGFLPVLGFWMIPLGAAILSLDIPPLRRWLEARLLSTKGSGDEEGGSI